ncbi:response regulator [candidate division WWE3 bacterium CG_4_9_14_0_2_um_filter_35_11]|uniref:Response regulator n=1 Tax=candidate division WWE3 bacterium CG_4_9_14_0_2_um_filter_35_11 TaxID=1975077 RepID=A0A2M8ELW2_UNCKA|nr:MAG: response regulator [candidate division WWE3 bacterium CG10_big_fil_rev_8_21_14_0_10_35_32]PJC23723.1 MAG: response regulator [candidate division WWE3 bacterium CG_4_9_14_0_2_um_filter_35_11]
MTDNHVNKKYILIAEDDNFYSSIYNQRLTEMGYEVSVASNGEQLLKLMKIRVPDLVMLDLIMPKMDGFETLQSIKEDANFKNVKVLVLSNLGQKEDVDSAMMLGAIGYIIKSNTSIQDVLMKVKESLS